jgi:hypothetical protein
MGPPLVIIGQEELEGASEGSLIPHDHVIETPSPQGPDQTRDERILPSAAGRSHQSTAQAPDFWLTAFRQSDRVLLISLAPTANDSKTSQGGSFLAPMITETPVRTAHRLVPQRRMIHTASQSPKAAKRF